MQVETLTEPIKKFILERFPLARQRDIMATDPLLGTGILDSLGVLEVVTFVEQEFGIAVTDEELLPENFESIEQIVRFVQTKRNGAPALQSEE